MAMHARFSAQREDFFLNPSGLLLDSLDCPGGALIEPSVARKVVAAARLSENVPETQRLLDLALS